MKRLLTLSGCFLLILGALNAQQRNVSVEGALKKWHKVTLNFQGKDLSENDAINPFLNYRLNVIFSNKNKTYVIPGFYAADGNAAETSATKGNVWKVRFMPDAIGEWSYKVSFRKGENIAVNDEINAGEPVDFDGVQGTFTITEADATGSDFRTKGRLQYVGERYLKHADTHESFIKGGADSPESFLGYYEFDQTPASHKYEPHAQDWKTGNPTWQNGKGKNIIGALNYLASKKMNSVYFLTMNIQGDGKDVWPWTSEHERYRFDCSKLDQWEIVFDHMDDLGLMLHIVTQETENELLLDIGETRVQRKLYYRELIARFAHHLGITWNLGEENGWQVWTPKAQNDKDRKAMARYIKQHDPYQNYVALHTHATTKGQDLFLTPLLGYEYLDGPSLQTHHPHDVHDISVKWINESKMFGKQWVITQDEIGPAHTGAKPDADDPEHNEIRAQVLWGNLMAGGAGVEWYFGYKFAHNDLNCEDWRSRDILWDQTHYALDFFKRYLPFETMHTADDLTANTHDYVLAHPRKVYAIYIPKVEETILDLTDSKSKFTIKWYNPRTGGDLVYGTVKTIKGGKPISIGFPPSNENDWVALVENTSKKSSKANESPKTTLNALQDFQIDNTSKVNYYTENKRGTLAINAAKTENRNEFASAFTIFKGNTGYYSATLNTIAENDGESEYAVYVNKEKLKTVSNPQTPYGFKATSLLLGKIYLKTNDTLEIASKAMTNGKIPEDHETAWSRGRWSSIILNPVSYTLKEALKDMTPFEEQNGFLEVEAEDYHFNSNNESPRKWYLQSKDNSVPFENTKEHSSSASGNAYIKALPDTRVTHKDPLIQGENFFPVPGTGGLVSYKVKINTPGQYYVWVRAYSSGPEDNGLHVGVDGTWPESGQRIQLCKGKHAWTWSSAQRVPKNHCGYPQTITLNFETPGEHIISFSMREDGFELDKWLLTQDKNVIPE
ncbi:DUF5060 domain-containing protein [Tamlana fucoidanivorans]|uniref:DUF5060 domain-containing protein n=1 Tax=Allotamlana fucoidanivorans TaxID=2583814 RepID=A0A5C4SS11_9FLAO|nr:DUF5060 domain-containing protein [Tamlana fucoidanivorans]TNJ47206.1 DUF5060 domain-containing protein [Tamlana fucoidanivorans]